MPLEPEQETLLLKDLEALSPIMHQVMETADDLERFDMQLVALTSMLDAAVDDKESQRFGHVRNAAEAFPCEHLTQEWHSLVTIAYLTGVACAKAGIDLTPLLFVESRYRS
jgi:hypothetical protein